MTDPASTESLLDQRLEIETPERVVITHDLAGIGSRFAAGTIDACFLLVPWCGAGCVLIGVMPMSGELKQEEMQALGMALVGVCYAILWLYFLCFETFWGGRTPGKRFLKLRVMSVHGGPAPASAVILRNVLRIVDSLPTVFLPFLGGLVMFLNRRSQRIGDLVAGTVVVRERPEALRVAPSRGFAADASSEVSVADLEEIDRFIVRRHELRREVRPLFADRLCATMRARYTLPQGDSETLLGLLAARRTPQQIRDLAGPAPAPRPRSPTEPSAPSASAAPASPPDVPPPPPEPAP